MIKSILGGKSKNLFDISKADVMINANIFNPIPVKWECFYKIPVTSGQTYTVSCDTTTNEGAGTQLQLSAQTGDKYLEGTLLFIFLTTPEMIKDWVHIKATFTIPENVTQVTFSTIDNKFFRNFQIELGSTATEYVPHELTSYKSIMKVSDVCQLANSKLFTPMNGDTVILEGVSITKNIEASTITFNGTSTGNFWYHVHDYASELRYTNLIRGYKYYISGMPVNDLGVVFQLTSLFNLQGEQIFTAPKTSDGIGPFDIYVPKGVTLTDFVVTPQLFNLTEMFGAGNEPKTVAEFKAKFPNDYYPYSPSCFVTSFDERMPCKTKNLFDKSNAQIINGYISESNVFSQSSLDKTIVVPCLPNTTYTFSKISVSPVNCDRLRIGDYTAIPAIGDTINNVVNIGEPPTQNYITITTSDTAKYIVVTIGLFNYTVITTLDYILSTCQLELGTIATDYVPYGYV